MLRALAPYVFLLGLGPLASLAVNFLGEARRRVPIAIVTVIVNVVIDLILIPDIGIVGGAIGTSVAYAIYVPAHLWVCRRLVGLPLMPLFSALLRTLPAAAAMAGVLVLFGTGEDVGVLPLLAGAVVGTLTFVAGVLATGAIGRQEAREVLARLRKRR